ncbi:MAG: GAF domain-containing sensor histidine kinase [Anaerolineae bacterium]|jgi:signal transduction histidine kinase
MIEQTQPIAQEQASVEGVDLPRLTGTWLRAARAGWILLALAALAIMITSLPGYVQEFGRQFGRLPVESQGTGAGMLLALSGLASLASAGLSLALAAIFFRRRFAEPVAATLSVYLLLYAVVMAGPLEVWSGYWLGGPGLVSTMQGLLLAGPSVALLVLFPDGRLVPGWTGWLLLLTIPWSLSLFFVPSFDAASLSEQSPVVLGLLAGGLLGLFAAGLYAQVVRYRRVSGRAERQQTKWVVYGLALWVLCLLLTSIPYIYLGGLPPDTPDPWWAPASTLVWFLSLNIVPVSLAIAVTRYHLWDIDLVINRTLVYGALTACVFAIYALVVGALGAFFHAQGNWLIAFLATGLVALLFQPLRERLQRGVNRLLYGHRDEPFEVLARLGQRMEDTFTPDLVLPTMVETIARTLKLPYVAITVPQGEAVQTVESYGKPTTIPQAYPLPYQGAVIGHLLVARRAPDEAFTAGEERLLRNIARQAGTAVHALQLTTDLQRARQQIVTSREEERRRLRRDLHDGLGPSLAAQLLKIGSARALLADRPEVASNLLADTEADIEGTLAEVRRIVYDLRPPALDQLGLAGALRAFAAACESGELGNTEPNLTVHLEMPGALPPLPAAVEVAAYHIAREGLTNVVRHAQARHCTLRLTVDEEESGHLHLSIHDDGQGFAANVQGGVGLASMRERAAELGGAFTLEASPGAGTRLTAALPLKT